MALVEPILIDLLVEDYEGEQQSGVYHGQGDITYHNGNKYEGDLSNGVFHGDGKFKWADKCSYQGTFTDSSVHGTGAFQWHDGSHYDGGVAKGLRHGEGSFHSNDSKVSYQGSWSQGARQGKGVTTYSDGSIYEGELVANMRHGLGTLSYSSGSKYTGEWKHNKRHGTGTMHWVPRAEIYTGDWFEGFPHGQGEHTWLTKRKSTTQYTSHNRYKGSFNQGQRQGPGIFYFADGSIMDGTWEANVKHGAATFVCSNGRAVQLDFEHDTLMNSDAIGPEQRSQLWLNYPDLHEGTAFQRQQLDNVIHRHLSSLRSLYVKYSRLGCPSNDLNVYILTRTQLELLLCDCQLQRHGFKLYNLDDVIRRVEPYWQSSFFLRDQLLLRHFIDALVRLAMAVHGPQFKDRPECVAYALDHLITHDLIPLATIAKPLVISSLDTLCETVEKVYEKQNTTGSTHALRWLQLLRSRKALAPDISSATALAAVRELHPQLGAVGDSDANFELSPAQACWVVQRVLQLSHPDSDGEASAFALNAIADTLRA